MLWKSGQIPKINFFKSAMEAEIPCVPIYEPNACSEQEIEIEKKNILFRPQTN